MVQFTLEELNKLAGMCDIATKAGGLQIAQEALPLVAKMEQIAKELYDTDIRKQETKDV